MTDLAARIGALSDLVGPPGREGPVREAVRAALPGHVRDVAEDALGNLLVRLSGGGGRRLLVLVPMDEPALVVTHIDHRGRGAVAALGAPGPEVLAGRRVVLASGACGVVAWRRIPEDDEDRGRSGGYERLWLDFGVDTRAQAAELAAVGDAAVPDVRAAPLAGGAICGKALSSRAACAAALLAARLAGGDLPWEATLAFVVQSEVGQRGVRPVVARCPADLILSLGAVAASGGGRSAAAEVRLGQGPALLVSDHGLIASAPAVAALRDAATRSGIALQVAVADGGTAAAGPALTAAAGAPAGALGFPVRHRRTPAEICVPQDVEGLGRVLAALLTGGG